MKMTSDAVEASGAMGMEDTAQDVKGTAAPNAATRSVIRSPAASAAMMTDMRELRQLYASNHLSDVLFVFPSANGTNPKDPENESDASTAPEHHLLPAHRLVLSLRSGAFCAALLRSKSSQVPRQVRFPVKIIVEDTSFPVFATLLRFLYTGEVAVEEGDALESSCSWEEKREQFWKDLLRAAYVYLTPSLVDICVTQLIDILTCRHPDDGVAEPSADTAEMRHLCKLLTMLIFCDGVVASTPNAAHHRASSRADATGRTSSVSNNGDLTNMSENESVTGDDRLKRGLASCMSGIEELQDLCLSRLEVVPDNQFEALLRSDCGKRCSTERLCDILRHRSQAPLVVAIRYELGRVVNELLRSGEPLDKTDDDEKDLPLVAALKTGNDSITRRLLVNLDAPFFLLTDKIPIFLLACASGNLLHCQILIDHNSDDVNLISPLSTGDKDILFEYGRHQTPLHVASAKGHTAVVELLLSNKAASNLQDEEGNTALHCVADIDTTKVLLSSEFRTNPNIPNRRGRTPLHVAAAKGNVGIVDLLIHHGGDQHILDDQGQNAFHVAAANGHTGVALVLLHDNESKHQAEQDRLRAAISKSTSESEEGEDTETKPNPIEDNICDDSLTTFDISQDDMKGNTALHLAAMSPSERCQKMLQLLLENGADPNRSNWFGYSPLHLFCSHQSGPASVIDVFIEHKTNIHTQSLDGSTPLHLAVGRASEEVAVSLVIAGAHVHLQDAAGRSVVDLAESTNQGVMLVPVLRNISVVPDWVSDDQVTECSSCNTPFRMAMRKHHCRHCGRIVCYNCSTSKIAIPKFQLANPVRVCDTCYDVLSFRRLL